MSGGDRVGGGRWEELQVGTAFLGLQGQPEEVYYFCDLRPRERLNQTLDLVKDIITGAATYFPMWEGAQVEGW